MDEPECSNRVEAPERLWQTKFEELWIDHQKLLAMNLKLERGRAAVKKAFQQRGYEGITSAAFKDWDRRHLELQILRKQIASGELVSPDQLGEIDVSQLRTNATSVDVQMDELNVQLEILKNELKDAEESKRLSTEQCQEVLAELAEERERSAEQTSLIRKVQQAYYQTGYTANLLEVEIRKVNKQIERFEEEVFERDDVDSAAQDARVARLSRLMAIKDAVEGVGSSGPGSTSTEPDVEQSRLRTRRQSPRRPRQPTAQRGSRGRTRPSASRWFRS